MKTLPILASIFAALAASVAAADNKTSWKISGELEESCSCNAACPCWFDSLPTMSRCSGNEALFIRSGHYGKTKLDGLAMAQFSQSPDRQTMMGSFGKWNFVSVYLDEKANPEQRVALEAIAKSVLPIAASPKTRIRFVPITRQISGKDHMVTVGKFGSFRGSLIEGGLGGAAKIHNPPGADPVHAEYRQGHAATVKFADAGQNWNFKGTNYMYGEFSVTSAQYEKFASGLAQKMAAKKVAKR